MIHDDNMQQPYRETDKMRDLVKENHFTILVMSRFGISLGFDDQTVREVCHRHQVDEQTFLQVVNFIGHREYSCRSISLQQLMNYLKQAHDYYLDFNLPAIRRKLIEAIDCSGSNDIALLILRFYDEYVGEVRRHMEYENEVVFVYVEQLLQGVADDTYHIAHFAGKHKPISEKLKELKDVIVRYCPEKNNYLLNAVLFDIVSCEADLLSHCMIEDKLFVPAVKLQEQKLRRNQAQPAQPAADEPAAETNEVLSDREKEILVCIAKGQSNKEIADTLCLSVHTVTTHRRNISSKLQIHSTAGLIIYAFANRLIDIQEIQH